MTAISLQLLIGHPLAMAPIATATVDLSQAGATTTEIYCGGEYQMGAPTGTPPPVAGVLGTEPTLLMPTVV